MNQKRYLFKGTMLLTLAGLLSRIAGFFYKIFLSRTIGAEQIGLYHLCMPILALCTAAAAGGMQTAISRYTAEFTAKKEADKTRVLLGSGIVFSVCLSIVCILLLYPLAPVIARRFLFDSRASMLLRICAISLPFSVIHACFMGYFTGRKQITFTAVSQLLEQLFRILSVVAFYYSCRTLRLPMAALMMLGQVAGELSSALFCLLAFYVQRFTKGTDKHSGFTLRIRSLASLFTRNMRILLPVSLPLGSNRVLLCVLQSIEAALLPRQLQQFGFTSSDALSVYGIFTGMTLPLILFPTAITSALGTILLPLISEAHVLKQQRRISTVTQLTLQSSLCLGLLFFLLFFFTGKPVGVLLFHNETAGLYIRQLGILCPFLYVNTASASILHGIGKTTSLSLYHTINCLLRLLALFLLVPSAGMNGYFGGMLLGQIFLFLATLLTLYQAGKAE